MSDFDNAPSFMRLHNKWIPDVVISSLNMNILLNDDCWLTNNVVLPKTNNPPRSPAMIKTVHLRMSFAQGSPYGWCVPRQWVVGSYLQQERHFMVGLCAPDMEQTTCKLFLCGMFRNTNIEFSLSVPDTKRWFSLWVDTKIVEIHSKEDHFT